MPMRTDAYPADWKAISLRIRERDGQRCKWCGVENHTYGARASDGRWIPEEDVAAAADNGILTSDEVLRRPIRIVLTVAHLDHDTTNNADDNLAALCQRCHLRYDAPMHAKHARATRRRKVVARGQMELEL